MKEKIFSKLKQAYSSLGLGDALLQSHADALSALGLVTDENIDSVISAQKPFLESVQKSNDKRVNDALTKSENAKKELEKKIEELSKITPKVEKNDTDKEAMIEEFKRMLESSKTDSDKRMAEFEKALTLANETVAKLQAENNEAKASLRQNFIKNKASELKIPDWRINEGFNITETMGDDEIITYLSGVANNVRANALGTNRVGIPSLEKDGKIPDDVVKSIAKNLVNK